jgi:hypothetical protein
MAIYKNTPPIVTNGLVLALDAANPKSYTSGSATWFDISGNNNSGSLTNGPTYSNANGGSIMFDGTNDFINCGTSDTVSFPGNFTINFWARPFGSALPFGGVIVSKRNSGTFQSNYQIGLSTSNIFTFSMNGTPFADIASVTGSVVLNNNWYNITCIKSGSTIQIYYNTLLQNSGAAQVGNSALPNTVLRLGQNHDLNAPFSGSLSLVQIYNRALTAQEVLQNYNATKGRFGL